MSAQQDIYMSSTVQPSFSFDVSDPAKAASEYARLMHSHTRRQYDTVASRDTDARRSSVGSQAVPSLNTETSNESTQSSVGGSPS